MEYLINQAPRIIPNLLVWVSAIVVAVILLRRGVGTPSTLFLAGSILMLIGIIVFESASTYVVNRQRAITAANLAVILTLAGTLRSFIGLAGIILIIVGFWKSATRQGK